MPKFDNNRVALMQGTLDMLVLRSLLLGPAHGHAIVKLIQQLSDEALQVDHGSLYPGCATYKEEFGRFLFLAI